MDLNADIHRLYFVDLDLVLHEALENPELEESPEDAAALLAQMLPVEYKVLVERGPAAGWPVVRFTGARADLKQLVKRYNGEVQVP